MRTIFRKLTSVCYERDWAKKKKKRNLLEKKIVTNKCLLLREKYNILNLPKREIICKKIGIYWWIKMRA